MNKERLHPIPPKRLLDEKNAYQEVKRTPWERFCDKVKPRSSALRTTLLVSIVVIFSLAMSLWFFWRTLYLPEIKQHARYLAVEIEVLSYKNVNIIYQDHSEDLPSWLSSRLGLELVSDPKQFPNVRDKFFAELFTDRIEKALAAELKVDAKDVLVYFQFKPSPRLWIKTPHIKDTWLKEPLYAYANYSPELIFSWLLGVPLLTMISILTLVRQINRPLHRLQNAANAYSKTGDAPYLETRHGPMEIRQVNQSFNHMISTLKQSEKERLIMLAGISHDLRTPLTRIRLTAELLPDEYIKEGLIYDVDDMDAILNQFISFMRDGSDEALHDTNINNLLQEIVVQFKPLDIRYSPKSLPNIQARSLSLKRMIGNLVNNAKRYGAEPVELDAYTQDDQVVIRIADHGEGIPESQVEELMQPFVRGESARTIQGSGLGLAIVRRIIDIHQGHLEIKNHQAGGLEVKIYLPISTPEATV